VTTPAPDTRPTYNSAAAIKALRPGIDRRVGVLLDELRAAGSVPVRRGRVDRKTVYSLLDLSYGSARFLEIGRAHLAKHDAILEKEGATRLLYENLHLQIRDLLERRHRDGTLVFERGRISRRWIADEMGIHTPVFVRYPKTSEVVEKFEASIADEIPASCTYPTLGEDLRELLEQLRARDELPVFKDHLNEAELARLLGVPKRAFLLVPECVDMLASADQEVRHEDPTRPFHMEHRRNYSFREIVPTFGRTGAAKIAARFCEAAGPSASAGKNQYGLVLSVFSFLGTALPETARKALSEGDAVSARIIERAFRKWRESWLRGGKKPHVASKQVVQARAVLERMAMFEDATDVLVPLPNSGSSRPKASLAEARVLRSEKVSGVVLGYAKSLRLDYDRAEVDAFVSNLALSSKLSDVGVDDLPDAIRKLNRDRLDRVLACAHLAFREGYERHAEGMALLARAQAQEVALDEVLSGVADGTLTKAAAVRFFTTRGEEGLAAFLYHVDRDLGGLMPGGGRDTPVAETVYYSKIVRGLGGMKRLTGLLHLCERTVAAACIVYVVEAGANSAVARGLKTDCMRRSTVPGYMEVGGWKSRAGGPIVTDLPIDHRDGTPSAISVLEAAAEIQPRLAQHARGVEHDALFLVERRGRVAPLSEHRLLHWLRKIASSSAELAEIELRVDMIRSSVLLDAALSADGNINVANAVANHSNEEMTAHYVVKMPLRIIYERKIRDFQQALASIAVDGVEGAAECLGLPLEKVKALAERAMSTGLGRMCLKPRDGIQPGTERGETCTRVDACSRCPAAVVVADVDLVADLVIWHGSLVEAAEGWPPEREERFAEAWLDDLAFCEAALEALARGPNARILRKARQAANKRLADPGYEKPRPW